MEHEHVRYLCCPKCCSDLQYIEQPEDKQARLMCVLGGHTYPIINGVPRFVELENYAANFGFQWNTFDQIQLDSYNNSQSSEQRFQAITGWGEAELAGKLVLDAGCGAGRFAEIVAGKYRANLVAFDLSSAVEACQASTSRYGSLVCQASIYDLPFKEQLFDFVYCIGVIQHTPDPSRSIRSLCRLVKPGGQIGLWLYELNWKCFVGTAGFKYALRPLASTLPRPAQVAFCKILVNMCYPIVATARRIGMLGKIVTRLLPVSGTHIPANLSPTDLKTWMFLDTFDMYSPRYDRPQRFSTVAQLLREEGFDCIQRHSHGAIAVTARRRA